MRHSDSTFLATVREHRADFVLGFLGLPVALLLQQLITQATMTAPSDPVVDSDHRLILGILLCASLLIGFGLVSWFVVHALHPTNTDYCGIVFRGPALTLTLLLSLMLLAIAIVVTSGLPVFEVSTQCNCYRFSGDICKSIPLCFVFIIAILAHADQTVVGTRDRAYAIIPLLFIQFSSYLALFVIR